MVRHIPSHEQIVDIFTKSLPLGIFTSLRFKLGVVVPPTPSLRGDISKMRSTAPDSAETEESVEAEKTEMLNDTVSDKGILGQRPNLNNNLNNESPEHLTSQRSTTLRVQDNKTREATEGRKRSVRQDRTAPIITTNRFDCLATCE